MSSDLIYQLIGVTATFPTAPRPALTHDLEIVPGEGLHAITFRVSDADFTGPTGERNLSDLRWLTPRALEHQEALSWLATQGPVYPFAFGSFFSTEKRVQRFLQEQQHALRDFLTRVHGTDEWALKVSCLEGRTQAAEVHAKTKEFTSAASGKSYLTHKLAARRAVEERANQEQRLISLLKCRLAERSDDLVERRIIQDAHGEQRVLANYALLLSRENQHEFFQWIEGERKQFQDQRLELSLTGPWPAFSFARPLAA